VTIQQGAGVQGLPVRALRSPWRMGRPCFRRVEVWPRMVAQAVAPSGLRWDPEVFCWVGVRG
jgi:hypothetical protein